MRNFRNTRKRGGRWETVFTCGAGRTSNDKCIQDFSDEANLEFIDVAPDGNCFFHTLELYYRRSGNQGVDKSYINLRETIINHILTNWNDYQIYGIRQEDIGDLIDDGAWNNAAGDLVVPAAARALNLQIKLYDFRAAIRGKKGPPVVQASPKKIIRHIYPDPDIVVPPESINILRINDGHFGLLVPRVVAAPVAVAAPAPVVPSASPRKRPVVAPPKNIIQNTASRLAAIPINKMPAKRTSARIAKKNNNGTTKNMNAKKQAAALIVAQRKANQTKKKAEIARKKAENANREERNLQKALLASMSKINYGSFTPK